MSGFATRRAAVGAVAACAAAVALLAAAAPENDSSCTSQSVPDSMATGATAIVSLTFRNTGSGTWAPSDGYLLGSIDADTGANWGVSSVALPGPVPAGATTTFSFRVTAPDAPGTYHFQWQLMQHAVRFGALSPSIPVKVVATNAAR